MTAVLARQPVRGQDPILTMEDLRTSKRPTLVVNEVAALLCVDPRTVINAINAGQIPAIRVGKQLRVPREPFLELLETGAVA